MKKRGLVTVFIILGLIVIFLLVLVFVFHSSIVENVTETEVLSGIGFSSKVTEVQNHIEECLELTLRNAVTDLGSYHVGDYESKVEEYIIDNLFMCIDYTKFDVEIEEDSLSAVIVDMDDLNTFITVEVNYPVTVSLGDSQESLSRFYAKVELRQNCCINVQVDSNCEALESGSFTDTCDMNWQVSLGQSLKSGGVCFAC